MASFSRKSKRKRRRQYSKGELNRLVDDLMHPLSDKKPALLILDTVLHGLVEQNPPETIRKFMRYNLSKILEEILKNL
jgi:hypothetical protein